MLRFGDILRDNIEAKPILIELTDGILRCTCTKGNLL